MKITLPLSLRKALLPLSVLCASTLHADELVRIDIDGNDDSVTLFDTNEDDVTMKFTAAANQYFQGNSGVSVDNILVESWLIGDGNTNGDFTFNGKVHGAGNILGWNKNGTTNGNHNYTFNGDMSEFSGNITSGSRGLALAFGGEARTAVSGKGALSITHHDDGITYDVGAGLSTIENSTIATNAITFNGVEGTIYDVSSAISATSLASNGASVNMQSGSSLAVTGSAVSANDLHLSLSGSSLTVLAGSSIGSLTLDGNVFLNLTLSETQASLTTAELTVHSGAQVTIQASITGGFAAGQSYTILDNMDDLTDISAFSVDFGAGASQTGLSISNGNLVYTAARASASLTWDNTERVWETGGAGWTGADTFESFDSVTFTNDIQGLSRLISIEGKVAPSSIVVSGEGNLQFGSEGVITGSTTLTKEGGGEFVLGNSFNDFTGVVTVNGGALVITKSNDLAGGVIVNDGAELQIDAENALGSGTATIKSGGTILFYGLANYESTSVIREDGSTLEFATLFFDPDANTNDNIKLGTGSLSGGRILATSREGILSIGGAIIADSTTDRYLREDEGYTVRVAAGSSLKDNVRLALGGDTTTITGGGTYEVHSVVLSASEATTILNIEQDTTLKVSSTVESEFGDQGAFMLSNYSVHNNEVNVAGTLDLAGGISDRDGTGTISVADTGTLIMREGLITHTGKGTKNVDINGGTLILSAQADNANHANNGLDVDIANGSTIFAASATTNVNTALGFNNAAGDAYTFGSLAGEGGLVTANKLSLRQTVTASNAMVRVTSGTLELGGADNTIAVAELSAGATLQTDTASGANMTITSATLAEGATIRSSYMSVGGVAITGKGGSDASIVGQAAGGSVGTASFNKVNLSNATIAGSPIARSVHTITSDGANYENVSFSNVSLTAVDTVTTLTGVTLNYVSFNTENTGNFTLAGSVSIANSVLDTASFSVAAGASIAYSNTTLTGSITAVKSANLTFNTLEGGEVTNVQAWTVSGVAGLFTGASGSLTLDLGVLNDYTETGTGGQQFAAFILDGVTSLGAIEYNDITLQFSAGGVDYTQKALGYAMEGGQIVLYIPEPSTATLSLLALAALVARRRRKKG